MYIYTYMCVHIYKYTYIYINKYHVMIGFLTVEPVMYFSAIQSVFVECLLLC